jgi:hypothetical protein
MVDAAPFSLAPLNAVKLLGLAHAGAHKAVVEDLAFGHPDGESRAARPPVMPGSPRSQRPPASMNSQS